MKRLSPILAVLLLASAPPAAAQYSYSGSAGALRTAPSKDKAVAAPNRPASPIPPNLAGGVNRTGGPQAAESRRTGEQPKPPSRVGTPLNSVPGQARPIPGMSR